MCLSCGVFGCFAVAFGFSRNIGCFFGCPKLFQVFFPFVCGWSGSLSSSARFTLHPVVSFLCMLLKIV